MSVKMIDEGELIFDIKFGQKRKGWIKVKLVSIPESQNSCPGCVMRKVCYDSPLCSKIITEIVSTGHILFTPRHYRLCRV